jgi:glycosyltransferase involved in cell wall biosynthesis
MQKKPIISRIIEGAKNCEPDPIRSGYLEQKNKHNEMIVSSLSQPLVTVIMPVYNGARYVSEAIESVLSQTYQNFELIIVNDGSNDDSKAVINPYLNDLRIRYYEQCNAGVAAARNTAIKESQGEFIGFLDQDDLWLPEKIEIQIQYFKKYPDISLTYSDYIIFNELENSAHSLSDLISFDLSQSNLNSMFIQNRIGVLTVLVKKQCVIDSGLLETELKGTDDYELWLRLALDYKFQYIRLPLATYRWHEKNISGDNLHMRKEEIKAIFSFLSKRPDAYKVLGKSIIKTRLFNLYNEIGDLYIWPIKNTMDAQHFYLLAFKQMPISLKAWELLKKVIRTSKTFNLMKYYQVRILSIPFGQRNY